MSERKLLSPVYAGKKNRDHEAIGCCGLSDIAKQGQG